MAAGLAAQSAKADLILGDTRTRVGAYDYNGGWKIYLDEFIGTGPWSILESAGVAVGASTGTAGAIRLHVETSFDGFAYADLDFTYFTVSYSATGHVSWDFNADGFHYFILRNLTDNVVMVDVTSGMGTQVVSLEVGKEYEVLGDITMLYGQEGKSFVELRIPAPAALPLLAAGGLLTASRRRRRE